MKLAARKDVPVEQTWDLSLIFSDETKMWEALDRTKSEVKRFVDTYAGKLNTAKVIIECLEEMETILISMEQIQSYAGLALETDYTDNALREREAKVSDEMTQLQSVMAFVDSEILLAPEKELLAAVEEAHGCCIYLQDLAARKAHMLSPETEKTLAALSMSFGLPYTVYNTMKLADISFDPFTIDGKEYPLGYSLFEENYELEANTPVRRAAFRAFYDTLKKYQNTTAAAYPNNIGRCVHICNASYAVASAAGGKAYRGTAGIG